MSGTAGVANPPRDGRDYYEILGLLPQAEGSDIRRAYWQLARRYHALAACEPLASAMLDELNEAAKALSTAALRRDYDASRREAVERGLGRATHTGTTPPAPASLEAVLPAAGRFTALRRLGMLMLLIVVAGTASAPATAGAGANETKMVRGASLTSAPIVFVGDSITDGAGATSLNATFTQLLRQRLDDAGFANGPLERIEGPSRPPGT